MCAITSGAAHVRDLTCDSMPGSKKDERRAFLDAKKREIAARAMMSYPSSSELEVREVEAFARLFDVLDGPIVIRHPHADLRLELTALLGPRISYLIAIGDYELTDLELIAEHVKKGDRVIELGGGAGLTAALSAKTSGQPVVVAEPDERLFPLIRRQVELNGGTVSFEHGAVLGAGVGGVDRKSAPASIDFFLDEEIWFSSMKKDVEAHGERERIKVTVPVLSADALFAKHAPTVAMIDVEGAEREIFAQPLTQAHKPRLLLIEIHFPHYGEKVGAEVIQSVVDQEPGESGAKRN